MYVSYWSVSDSSINLIVLIVMYTDNSILYNSMYVLLSTSMYYYNVKYVCVYQWLSIVVSICYCIC